MFLPTSRYFNVATVQLTDAKGRTVTAVTLRRLPATAGDPTEIQGNDGLAVMSQRNYQDPTRFWHIADANTELEASALTKGPEAAKGDSRSKVILVPRT